jgi:pimeloyl-ACP methyl ester carboxylesterase
MATIVLVGGAFLGAWAWERVTPVLVSAGHDVLPLTLTGLGDRADLGSTATTMATHAADIADAIEGADLRDVVLVAHSYGGIPATVAASRVHGRIGRLVYVAAALPEPGRSLFDRFPPGLEDIVLRAVDTEGDGWRIPALTDVQLDTYWPGHGFSPEDRAWLQARMGGQPVNTYRDRAPEDLSTVEALPRTYVVCAADPGEPPRLPGMDMVTLDSGHWPMVTRPAELARVIDQLARA